MGHTIIIGGGIAGLFSAWYLSEKGHTVTVVDRSDFRDNCSHGNAGMIVPSHVIPMAAPGMIAKGMRWMLRSDSPFYVRPRLSPSLFSWGWSFYRSATLEHVNRSKVPLRDLSLLSKALYRELYAQIDAFNYQEKGLLMLYQSEQAGAEEKEAAQIAQELGLQVDFLDRDAVQSLEHQTTVDVLGAVHYRSDAHLDPNKLMVFLKDTLAQRGVTFCPNQSVQGFEISGERLSGIRTQTATITGDHFVIAAGAWSRELAKFAGEKLQLLPGKGYSFMHAPREGGPTIPSILCEGKVAVTPMENTIRFGGTLEVTHVNDRSIHRKRVQGIVDTIGRFYPDMNVAMPQNEDIWSGFRPCAPDGLPYLGRSVRWKNLFYATGHGMMGLSLGPATGKLVAQLIGEEPTEIDIDAFRLR